MGRRQSFGSVVVFFADIFLGWWRGVFVGVFAKSVVQTVVF
jgi:hypothetical protein